MKVGFTGTQNLNDISMEKSSKLYYTLNELYNKGYTEFHHGDCIGADALAHDMALQIGYDIIIHPPSDMSKRAFKQGAIEKRKSYAYMTRNQHIVNEAEILVALPKNKDVEELRSGTWATVRRARKADVPIIYI